MRIFRGRKPVEAFAVKPSADSVCQTTSIPGWASAGQSLAACLRCSGPPACPSPCTLPTAIRGVPSVEGGVGVGALTFHPMHFCAACISPTCAFWWEPLSSTRFCLLFPKTCISYTLIMNVSCSSWAALHPGFSYFVLLPASPAFSFLHSHLLLFLLSPGVPALPSLFFFFCVGFGGLYLCRICFRDSLNIFICNYIHYLLLWWLFL